MNYTELINRFCASAGFFMVQLQQKHQPSYIRDRVINVLAICLIASSVVKQDVFEFLVTSLCSEEDGLPSSFILDVGGEAFEELGILSLGHGSED